MSQGDAAAATRRWRAVAIWVAVGVAVVVPLAFAATSPLLAWRQPVYILAGFAGILGLCLMLAQPLLAAGYLPGLTGQRGRRLHRVIGVVVLVAVVVHVIGLWLTSPPDVVDALLLVSPTPFSVWGVLAMWALFGAAALAALRRRLRWAPRRWRMAHGCLVAVVVAGTVLHALLIDGTMEPWSKALLCLVVAGALVWALTDLRPWGRRGTRR